MRRNRHDLKKREEHKLYMIKITQIEMMKDRGFDIKNVKSLHDLKNNEDAFFDMTEDAFHKFYEEQAKTVGEDVEMTELLSGIYIYKRNRSRTLVFYKKGDNMVEFKNNVEKKMAHNYILIIDKDLKSSEEDFIKNESIRIEVFKREDLYVNPTKQAPIHEALTEQQQKLVIKNNGFNIDHLPKMSPDDKIAKYYGFVPGQMIKIYRTNSFERSLVKTSLTYRIIPDVGITKIINQIKTMKENIVEET